MRIVRLMLVPIIREKVIVVKNPKDHWSGCHSISFKSPVFAWSWSFSWQKCCSYKQEEDLVYIKMLCVCLYIQVLEQQSLTNVGSKRSFDSASDNALVQSLTYHVKVSVPYSLSFDVKLLFLVLKARQYVYEDGFIIETTYHWWKVWQLMVEG